MKNILIAALFLWAMMSCTNSQNKNSVHQPDDEIQPIEKITNSDFKTFIAGFAFGNFPWDVSETPLFADGEVPANFHELSLEGIKEFISPDATESKGYYTGYAIFENEYIAIIYFYSYSSLFGGDNYNTSANLLTFNFDGKLTGGILLGETNTRVNSNAQRESQKMEGSIYSDKITTIKINNFLEDEPSGSGNSVNFLIRANGEIDNQ